MSKLITVCICLFSSLNNYSQAIPYIGLESSIGKDLFVYSDLYETPGYVGPDLQVKSTASFSLGFNLGWQFNDYFAFETGLIFKQTKLALGFNQNRNHEFSVIENLQPIFLLPLRCQYRFDIINDKLYFISSVGLNVGFNAVFDNTTGLVGGALKDESQIYYDYFYTINSMEGSLLKPLWFCENSVGLGWSFFPFFISAEACAIQSLKQIHSGFFTYNVDESNLIFRAGNIHGSGDYLSCKLKFIYSFNANN